MDSNEVIKIKQGTYKYKENEYEVVGMCRLKCTATGNWVMAVRYTSKLHKLEFIRELNDFISKFKPMVVFNNL